MKTSIKLLAFSALFILASCQKVKENIIEKLLTFEEASHTIETLLNSANCGLVDEIENLAQMASENYELFSEDCNYGIDTSINCGNDSGLRAWNYTLNYSWGVTCDELNIPQTIKFVSSKMGDFKGTRLEQSGNSHSNLQLVNLSPIPVGTNYVLNGSHNFTGSQELLIRDKSMTLTINIDLTNIEITKSTYEIVTGTGNFTIVAENGNDISEMIEGELIFLGNGQAEVTINGETFLVSI